MPGNESGPPRPEDLKGHMWVLTGESQLHRWQLLHWSKVRVGMFVLVPPFYLPGEVIEQHWDGFTVRYGGETVRLQLK
jgi:hypothetical protein